MADSAKGNKTEKIAFVICPISDKDTPIRKRSDQILKHVIRPAVEKFGYTALRADDIPKPGIITTQIVGHILNDALVIADLTGHNPNVFYELAIRHLIRKPIIQIIQKDEHIPFDVSQQRTIEIDHKDLDSADEARRLIEKQIVAVEADPTLVDSPILTAVNTLSLKASNNPEQAAIAAIQSSLANLTTEFRYFKQELSNASLQTNKQRLEEFERQAAMAREKEMEMSYNELLKKIELKRTENPKFRLKKET